MSINPGGPQVVARRMETIAEPPRFNVGTVGHVDIAARALVFEHLITSIEPPAVLPPPSHWPPRPTRMCLAVRLGITRILLENGA